MSFYVIISFLTLRSGGMAQSANWAMSSCRRQLLASRLRTLTQTPGLLDTRAREIHRHYVRTGEKNSKKVVHTIQGNFLTELIHLFAFFLKLLYENIHFALLGQSSAVLHQGDVDSHSSWNVGSTQCLHLRSLVLQRRAVRDVSHRDVS